ncbi:MAG: hypothetical protein JWM28_376 [Chitinophagaceae bacterium]|jgi:hypothetical protein|nr:hypothetical protein [Chitinophagaceae bacterium]
MTTTIKQKSKGKLAGTKHVDQLIRNYKKDRWIQNSQRLGKEDSLSTWFGLDELGEFLQLAKQHKADGIKIYYGVYGNEYTGDPELRGRQTVVLVATKQNTAAGGLTNKDIYIQRDNRSEILAFNFGHICPPYCTTEENGENDFGRLGVSILQTNHTLVVI